ncbi:hypothetical protein M395_03705 [Enterococcus faecium T110]|nr:hypothetical protein M395_03705 [Enterococcus faecium T110]
MEKRFSVKMDKLVDKTKETRNNVAMRSKGE